MRALVLALALAACGKSHSNTEQTSRSDPRVDQLRAAYAAALTEAAGLRDPTTGWLTPGDCDGFLWTGKYAAATGVTGVNMMAAEHADEPGLFDRRPPVGACGPYDPNGKQSSWSKDMGTGLLTYAFRTGDRGALERHEAYGRAHDWLMGAPVGDGRAVYTPSFIGRLYETIFVLGGSDNANRWWPDFYPKGLTDFEAHLQVMGTLHRGEIEDVIEGKAAPNPTKPTTDDQKTPPPAGLLDINDSALGVLRAQAARDSRDPLFQATLGVYTGDMGPAITACLAADQYAGEYVRCNEFRRCQLAAWIYACDVVLRRYPKTAPAD